MHYKPVLNCHRHLQNNTYGSVGGETDVVALNWKIQEGNNVYSFNRIVAETENVNVSLLNWPDNVIKI